MTDVATDLRIRADLTIDERSALVAAVAHHYRGDGLIEIADALGLCSPRMPDQAMPVRSFDSRPRPRRKDA